MTIYGLVSSDDRHRGVWFHAQPDGNGYWMSGPSLEGTWAKKEDAIAAYARAVALGNVAAYRVDIMELEPGWMEVGPVGRVTLEVEPTQVPG